MRRIISLGAILAALWSAQAPAQLGVAKPAMGHGEGNGGDAFTLEFTAIALKIHGALATRPATAEPKIDAKAFKDKLDEVNLSPVDEVLYLDGVPKDVINYPRERKIVISRPRWKSSLLSQKYGLVARDLRPDGAGRPPLRDLRRADRSDGA